MRRLNLRPAALIAVAALVGAPAITAGSIIRAGAAGAATSTCGTTAVTLKPDHSSVRVGGKETLSITVAKSGLPDPTASISFTHSDPAASVGAASADPTNPGSEAATYTAGTAIGAQTVTASSGGCAATVTVNQFGVPAAVTVVAKPASIPATPTPPTAPPASTAVTARIVDAANNPVTDESPTLAVAPAGGPSCGSATNNGDGTYSWSCTASSTQAKFTLTVTAKTPAVSGSTFLYQTGPAAAISVGVSPAAVPADGLIPATATAVVTDQNGFPVAGDTVTFTNSPAPAFAFSPASGKTGDDGSFSSSFVPPAAVGSYKIFAKGSPATAASVNFAITPAPAAVSLTLNPAAIQPDGKSTTTATATVTDAAGARVSDAVVTLTRSATGTAKIATHNNGDGTYSATLTSATTPQAETITATTENAKRAQAALDETAQPGVGLQLTPSRIPADGQSTASLLVVFENAQSQPEPGHLVTLSISGDAGLAPKTVTTGPDGSATATVTASRTVGRQTITATSGGFTTTIGITLTPPVGSGYALVARDGGIFTFGSSHFHGSTGNIHLNQPIVGMALTPSGLGYWLVASDGGIFSFGDAVFHGSTGNIHLNQPIVGMASSASGAGYWLVATDGGIFAFGDALFRGSAGAVHLNQPIVGMAPTADGLGYWLVASDGGIFNYGDAPFLGSAGAVHLNQPIVGMAATSDGLGYWLAASDGGIFNYGDAGFWGSTGAIHLNQPIVGMGGD